MGRQVITSTSPLLPSKSNPDIAMVPLDNSSAPDPAPPIAMDEAEAQRDTTIVPLVERTFAESNFKRFYSSAQAAAHHRDLLADLHNMVTLFATRVNPPLSQEVIATGVHSFMAKIRTDAFGVMSMEKDLQNDVDAVAEYLWTSGKQHAVVRGMSLSSVLNAVIRDDIAEEIEAAAPIFLSINNRRVCHTSKLSTFDLEGLEQSYPSNGESWRGGGFRNRFRPFFERIKGQKYRVPGFLATSNQRSVASGFAFKANKNRSRALWRVTFDRRGKKNAKYRVQHMSFVSKTLIKGEGEYLFAPYSVFTLVSVKWSAKIKEPHHFNILAAVDNQDEGEDLPLAPWY